MGVAWASLGLLAAVSFAFFALTWTQRGEFSAGLAALGSDLRGAIEAQGAKTDALGVELRAAIATQSDKVDALGTELRGAIATQGDKIDAFGVELRSAIATLSARIEEHASGHRHAG